MRRMNLCGETLRVIYEIYIFFIFAKFAKILYFQPKNVFQNDIRTNNVSVSAN